MITADCHVHSTFSTDGMDKMEAMLERGIALGLRTICFTDHMDYEYPSASDGEFQFHVEDYFKYLELMRKRYEGRIEVNAGIELGLMPHLSDRCDALVQSYPFDFIIASTHVINHQDPYQPEFWKGKTPQQGIMEYFQRVLDNMEVFTNFDSCAHLDYIIRYAPNQKKDFIYEEFKTIIDKILLRLIALDKCLEINTGGFKYGLNATNPGADIVKRYYELGGRRITIGSDAHKAGNLTDGFKRAEQMLTDIGYQEYSVFYNRKPAVIPF